MFERVRIRLTALTVAIFICLYALSSTAIYGIVRHTVMQGIDQRLVSIAHRVERLGQVPELPGYEAIYIYAEAPNGTAITNAPNSLIKGLQEQARRGNRKRPFATWTGPRGYRYRVYNISQSSAGSQSGYEVLIAQNITDQLDVLSPLQWIIVIVGMTGTIVAAAAGFWWAGRALRPVRTAWDKQLRFVSDASHELRTPLAVIQSNLDLVLDHSDQTVEENLEWVGNAQSEARRLGRLVQDLLTLARSDAQTAAMQFAPVSLPEIIHYVVDMFEPMMEMRDQAITTLPMADVTVLADRDRLTQLVLILVDNACKYTGAGGHVTISAEEQKNHVLLRVADDGPGIAPADLPHVFERFYRADKARARDDEQGTGLGLSIAQWIVQAHRGKIQMDSEVGKGTTVTVTLPVQGSAKPLQA